MRRITLRTVLRAGIRSHSDQDYRPAPHGSRNRSKLSARTGQKVLKSRSPHTIFTSTQKACDRKLQTRIPHQREPSDAIAIFTAVHRSVPAGLAYCNSFRIRHSCHHSLEPTNNLSSISQPGTSCQEFNCHHANAPENALLGRNLSVIPSFVGQYFPISACI